MPVLRYNGLDATTPPKLNLTFKVNQKDVDSALELLTRKHICWEVCRQEGTVKVNDVQLMQLNIDAGNDPEIQRNKLIQIMLRLADDLQNNIFKIPK